MSHLKYWVWLSTRRGLAGVTMQRVLDHFGGPERVYYAHARDVDELTELSGLARSSLKDKSMREVERILDRCDQLGIRVMTRQDAVYPQRLENIPQPPLVLYAKGRPISLDDGAKLVTVDGEPVSLTPIEYNILKLLMTHPGQVFSSAQIYEQVWNDPAYGSENTVAVHIRHLREKIEINPAEPRYLKVVWGLGYKMDKGGI